MICCHYKYSFSLSGRLHKLTVFHGVFVRANWFRQMSLIYKNHLKNENLCHMVGKWSTLDFCWLLLDGLNGLIGFDPVSCGKDIPLLEFWKKYIMKIIFFSYLLLTLDLSLEDLSMFCTSFSSTLKLKFSKYLWVNRSLHVHLFEGSLSKHFWNKGITLQWSITVSVGKYL